MSKTKEIFSSLREEEITEEYLQDILFIESDREERVIGLKEEIKEQTGNILVEETKKLLPF